MGKLVALLNVIFLVITGIGLIYIVFKIVKMINNLNKVQFSVFAFMFLGFLWIFNTLFL